MALWPQQPAPAEDHWLRVGARRVRLRLVRNRRARRYVLRLRPDGSARAHCSSRRLAGGGKALCGKECWLAGAAASAASPAAASSGSLEAGHRNLLSRRTGAAGAGRRTGRRAGSLRHRNAARGGRRRTTCARPWSSISGQLAAQELPARVFELAALHRLPVRRVTVRNQRSRWGSCSRRGTISLNWRLVQAPLFVRDYLVLHELAHLREMNHSRRFWSEVARLCPDFREAERWLKQHAELLR